MLHGGSGGIRTHAIEMTGGYSTHFCKFQKGEDATLCTMC